MSERINVLQELSDVDTGGVETIIKNYHGQSDKDKFMKK